MKTLPSKELLSTVLGEEVTFIYKHIDEFNRLFYVVSESMKCNINIHELAHMVKEFVNKHNMYILSYYQDGGFALVCKENEEKQNDWHQADSEPEAIFKAGEWILKEKTNAIS